jgi:hypothetical protein
MLNFNDIASTKVEDVKKVPLPPAINYRWAVTKLPTIRDFKGSDGTEYQSVDFPCRVVAPLDEFDEADYPGKPTDIVQSVSFMFDKSDEIAFQKMQNRLKKFLLEHLKVGNESMSFKELFNEAVNAQFIAPIVWRPSKNDPEDFNANIGNTAPLD